MIEAKQRWTPWLIGAAVFVSIAIARMMGWLEPIELSAYDAGMRLRAGTHDNRVVLILEREADIRRYGFPIPDAQLGALIENLARHDPAVIGIDKYRDIPAPGQTLQSVINNHPNVYWIYRFSGRSGSGIGPPPSLAGTDRIGFNDLVVDPDGVVRRAPLFLDDESGGEAAVSFPLLLAMRVLSPLGIAPSADPAHPEDMRLGAQVLRPLEKNDGGYARADARGFQIPIGYRAGVAGFAAYSVEDVLEERIPDAALRGKVVIVGGAAESVRDVIDTPIHRFGESGHQSLGVEVLAHVTSQLIRGALGEEKLLRWWPDTAEYLTALALCVLGAWVGYWLRRPLLICSAILGVAATIVAGSLAALALGWWLAVIPAALGYVIAAGVALIWRAYAEFKERQTVMRLFSCYVSRQVADEIWAQRDQFMANGKPKPALATATVLFSDVAGFTSIAESMRPESLFSWLDNYMGAMASVVNSRGGVVSKFIGDAIMALYGVPITSRDPAAVAVNAKAAVASALEMRSALEQFNRQFANDGGAAIHMRIGICTGPLAWGTIGIGERLEFTVIGDTVNVASRLESLKTVGVSGSCRILVCATTYALVCDRYEGTMVGAMELKGRDNTVVVHEIIGETEREGEEA